ncbi:MAG: hypothetical protein ACKVP1_01040 [Burkholderiaceae bacterium]
MRLSRAKLLKRVFELDLEYCPWPGAASGLSEVSPADRAARRHGVARMGYAPGFTGPMQSAR